MDRKQKKARIESITRRLELYKAREEEMLSGGVQSYGVGSRNATRYNTDLNAVRDAIKELEDELAELEGGGSRRKAIGVIPRDW